MVATQTPSKPKAALVILAGPFPDRRPGRRYYSVRVADANGIAIGTVYRPTNFLRARWLATNMAIDRRLDLVDETPAF